MDLVEEYEALPVASQVALIVGGGMAAFALLAVLRKRSGGLADSASASIVGSGMVGSGAPFRKSDEYIASLHPAVASRARDLVARMRAEGFPIVVTQGYRTMEQQAKLYAQGRTAPGAIVTNALPGSSWHNFALAFDVAPLDADGQPHWPQDESLWQRIGAFGKALGLFWGGDFAKVKDWPHFEYHPGLTLEAARAGQTVA